MITKTISYTDFNGKQRSEDFNFHLNKAELIELQAAYEGGWDAHLQRVVNTNNNAEIFRTMKDFILRSFGVKSEDGRRFKKVDENGAPLSRIFEESPAYEILLMELTLGPNAAKAAADFINGVMPKDMPAPDTTPAAIPAAT